MHAIYARSFVICQGFLSCLRETSVGWVNILRFSEQECSLKSVKIMFLVEFSSYLQICPGLNANEIQIPHDRHHKMSSLVLKSHQNKQNSVKHEVIWKFQVTLPNVHEVPINNT